MNKRNVVLLATIQVSASLVAMNGEDRVNELMSRIQQARTKAEITSLVTLQNLTSEITFGTWLGFRQGGWGSVALELLTQCFAQDLEPFVFGNRNLEELVPLIAKYPGINVEQIHGTVTRIRAGKAGQFDGSIESANTLRLRDFVAKRTGNNNFWTGKNNWRARWRENPIIVSRITVAAVMAVVAGIGYGIYRVFFAKSVAEKSENEIELDEQEKGVNENSLQGITHEQA